VREQVVAALVRGDEAKAFAVVEPLNGTGIHEESLRKKINEIALDERLKRQGGRGQRIPLRSETLMNSNRTS
jgi:hypothetical protein